MKLLIDANIILDVLMKHEPFYQDSSLIWKLCETEQDEGHVSALTFANLVYVMRKELTPKQIESVLSSMRLIFRFDEMNEADLINAAALKWTDFEDAIQSVTAERIKADCIITRNVRDFRDSIIVAFTPAEYLARR
ncbi:MAG: PIN domain-containing protein [Oscillospiraceae bacterium]|nr:PIN domain-containing protein [Oscillospiraceae bacterium]